MSREIQGEFKFEVCTADVWQRKLKGARSRALTRVNRISVAGQKYYDAVDRAAAQTLTPGIPSPGGEANFSRIGKTDAQAGGVSENNSGVKK